MADVESGWHAEVEIAVGASPERVWAIVSDISRHPALAGSEEVLAIRMDGPLAVGTSFESDVRTGEVGTFSPHCVIEAVDEPTRLAWVSLFPLDPGETEDHQIEVHRAFDISPESNGARVRHTVRIPMPKAGGDELASFFERTDRIATVRAGMQRTLENVQAVAE